MKIRKILSHCLATLASSRDQSRDQSRVQGLFSKPRRTTTNPRRIDPTCEIHQNQLFPLPLICSAHAFSLAKLKASLQIRAKFLIKSVKFICHVCMQGAISPRSCLELTHLRRVLALSLLEVRDVESAIDVGVDGGLRGPHTIAE